MDTESTGKGERAPAAAAPHQPEDIRALRDALELFTQTTQAMEEAYRGLEQRVHALDQELTEKNRELALTTEYLGSLLEAMSDGVIACDPNGTIVKFNRAAGQTLGYGAEEVVGRTFRDVFARDFTAATPEAALRAKSGRGVPVIERDSTMADRNGQHIGHVKTFQDQSEIHALREQMRQVDRLAAVGEMAATVAHEIRNPLGGLRGFAELLARDLADDPPRARLVEKIVRGTKSLDRVVNELLEFTRPVSLSLEPVACHGVVESALPYVELNGRAVRVRNASDAALRVLADSEKLRQVLLNVLLNAVESIEAAGEARVYTEAAGTHVDLVVADTGRGMSEEERAQMFHPFFTTKERGTGLGLAVCQKIIEGHGGEMWAESAPGAGTRVYIRLPRAE